VPKQTVVAWVLTPEGPEPRPFGTMTADLLAPADGLLGGGGTHVALERTADDWKPGFNILEGTYAVGLVNAQPGQAVPGRKPAVNDAAGLAERLPPGVLRARGLPPVAPRARRDLTRSRGTVMQARGTRINRGQPRWQAAKINLAAGL
jgi:transposase